MKKTTFLPAVSRLKSENKFLKLFSESRPRTELGSIAWAEMHLQACLKAVLTQYLVEFGVQRAAELHVLHQVRALALVRRDNANLVRFGSGLQQTGGDLLHVSSFSPENRHMILSDRPFE